VIHFYVQKNLFSFSHLFLYRIGISFTAITREFSPTEHLCSLAIHYPLAANQALRAPIAVLTSCSVMDFYARL